MINKTKKIFLIFLVLNICAIFLGVDSPSNNSNIEVYLQFENHPF